MEGLSCGRLLLESRWAATLTTFFIITVKIMKKALIISLFALIFVSPLSASAFTQPQIDAILGLLEAFNADANVIDDVRVSLETMPNTHKATIEINPSKPEGEQAVFGAVDTNPEVVEPTIEVRSEVFDGAFDDKPWKGVKIKVLGEWDKNTFQVRGPSGQLFVDGGMNPPAKNEDGEVGRFSTLNNIPLGVYTWKITAIKGDFTKDFQGSFEVR